ncbi:hypothetical protein ABTQ33_13240 (plasmid) [Paucilactobacillus suebicus]|uniref:Uncharacterized protein n=1 Tax=Paucilactobacillus suebicus DSM 5007 = KCTC 3549 TaxID=1423807 RepID=A0A0R1W145_9LACO|nr:hypothetical protein [Paucilactobacillus suebicus]KRM09193.1 hypothetical protein FD16_GL001911 [Paucilactobacillus suebicus DSM 5007 = KCTC 3549]
MPNKAVNAKRKIQVQWHLIKTLWVPEDERTLSDLNKAYELLGKYEYELNEAMGWCDYKPKKGSEQ